MSPRWRHGRQGCLPHVKRRAPRTDRPLMHFASLPDEKCGLAERKPVETGWLSAGGIEFREVRFLGGPTDRKENCRFLQMIAGFQGFFCLAVPGSRFRVLLDGSFFGLSSPLRGDANLETLGFAASRRWTGRSAGPYGLAQLAALLGLAVRFPWCFALLVVRGVARLAWPVACALGSDVYRGASCSC